MMQAYLDRNYFAQISVSRKFRITEDYTFSANKVVQNSVIRNFLITEKKEHYHGS